MKLFSTIIVLSFVFILTACAACTDPDIPGTLPPQPSQEKYTVKVRKVGTVRNGRRSKSKPPPWISIMYVPVTLYSSI